MSDSSHDKRFPGESDAYRSARNELRRAELDLRQNLEEVAALRRKLPRGGMVKEDYDFEEMSGGSTVSQVKLSELFATDKKSLVLYSFMYGPDAEQACPMCSSFLDGLDGLVPHITQRVNLAVIAKSPIARIREFTDARGWNNLRLLSSCKNSYNADYFAETSEGYQLPLCNVFTKSDDGIHHFWASEMLFAPLDGHARQIDLLWPLWNFLDLTPEGRGTDWLPQLEYSS